MRLDKSVANVKLFPTKEILPFKFEEPSYMKEFREISSHYSMDEKEDSEEISSCGEFERA